MKSFGLSLLLSLLCGAPAMAGEAPGVSAGGITLKSASVTFPSDPRQFAGNAADAINANCLTCHSAGMVFTQPHLSKAEWEAEVAKMKKVYGAPVLDTDVSAIVAYLVTLSVH